MLLANPSGCSCICEPGSIQKGYNSKTKPFCFRLLVKMLIINKQQEDLVPDCPLAEQLGQKIWQLSRTEEMVQTNVISPIISPFEF